MMTGCDDRGVRLQLWNGAAWGSASVLTSDCGTYTERPFDAEYEQTSGELLAVYAQGTSTSLYSRTHASATPSEQTFAAGFNSVPVWMKLVTKHGSDELVLIVATATNLYGMVWNGSAFGNQVTLSTTLPGSGHPYSPAYELTSGHAMVVWGNNASSTPQYRTWNGTSWSSAASLPAVGGTPVTMELIGCPKKTSNELLVSCIDSANHISVCNWTGSAWGTMTTIDTAAASTTERRVGMGYQLDGTKALVVWPPTGQTAVRYRTWSGTAWSGAL